MNIKTKSFLIKAVLSLLCVCSFIAGLITLSPTSLAITRAETQAVEITPDYSWYSTEASEYTINSVEQLVGLSNITNGKDNKTKFDFAGKTVKLTADLSFAENQYWYYNDGTTLRDYKIGSFAGAFDATKSPAEGNTLAQTYTISALKMFNSDLTSDNRDPQVGLFAEITATGTVSNLTLDGIRAELSGYDKFGFIAMSLKGTAENCHVKNVDASIAVDGGGKGYTQTSGGMFASVSSATINNCSVEHFRLECFGTDNTDNVGALAGSTSGAAKTDQTEEKRTVITNCSVEDVTYTCTKKTKRTGGFVGSTSYTDFIDCTAKTITIIISDYYQQMGGFAGIANSSSKFTRCKVIGLTVDGDAPSNGGYIAGFVAQVGGSSVEFTDCAVTELALNIECNPNIVGHAAGFIGYNSGSCVADGCKVEGTITATGGGSSSSLGGFVGLTKASISIENCDLSGVTIDASDTQGNTGGIIGKVNAGDTSVNITNSSGASSISTGGVAGGLIGYVTTDTEINFTGENTPSASVEGGVANEIANAQDRVFEIDTQGNITTSTPTHICYGTIGAVQVGFDSIQNAINAGASTVLLLQNSTENFTLDRQEGSTFTFNLGEFTYNGTITIIQDVQLTIKGTSQNNNLVLTAPFKDHHVFAGWYTDNTFAEGTLVENNTVLSVVADGTTYYAKFEQSDYQETTADQRTLDFGSIIYGENAPQAQSFTFEYNGLDEASNVKIIAIDTNDYFETSFNGLTATITPKGKLNAGTYQELIRVTTHDNATHTLIAKLVVGKATFDVNSISFADKTVKYDGQAQSIEISGTLPSDITVEYTGNGKTDVGVYTITVSFIYDANNYNEIAPMTATLTINNAQMISGLVDANGNSIVIITSGNGFAPDVEIVATEIPLGSAQTGDVVKEHEKLSHVFDIALKADGAEIQPSEKITVKLLIPTLIKDKQFRLVHNHDGEFSDIEYTVEGDYVVFTTDTLSEFLFVYDNTANVGWLIGVLAGVATLAVACGIGLFVKLKKKQLNNNKGVN